MPGYLWRLAVDGNLIITAMLIGLAWFQIELRREGAAIIAATVRNILARCKKLQTDC